MVKEQELRELILLMIDAGKQKDETLFKQLNKVFETKYVAFLTERNMPQYTSDKWDKARNCIASYFQFLKDGKEKFDFLDYAFALIS